MKKFFLINKSGEVINTTMALSFEDATTYFAKIKKLPIDDLQHLFTVK